MKKLFFVIVALLCVTQIVSAQKGDKVPQVTTLDATLKYQGTENEASTVAWLQSPNPDVSKITMPISSFNKEFKNRLVEFNNKYQTFTEITDDVINNEIIPKLYVDDLDPNTLYRVSRYDLETKKWGSYPRKPKKLSNGKIESGLFYPGWEEPVLSVYCWNFGYPSSAPVAPVIKPAERQEQKREYVFIPGTTKVIEHGTDTVKEIFSTFKEVERNTFNKINNQTFTLEAQQASYVQSGCNHQQVQQCNYQVQQASCNHQQVQQDCGCREDYSCKGHKKVKNKKPFMQRPGTQIATHLIVGAGGYFLGRLTGNRGSGNQGETVTQGPFEPIVLTQGPLN